MVMEERGKAVEEGGRENEKELRRIGRKHEGGNEERIEGGRRKAGKEEGRKGGKEERSKGERRKDLVGL